MKSGATKILIGLGIFIAFSLGFLINEVTSANKEDINQSVFNNETPLDLSNNLKVQGKDGATCTTSNEFVIVISGGHNENNKNDIRYRVFCDKFDSDWVNNGTITIPNLINPGAYTARIKASDNPESPNNGNIKETTFTFFKLQENSL